MEESPRKYERHIFVCINERVGRQACGNTSPRIHTSEVEPVDGNEIVQQLRDHINQSGLVHKYNITKVKCLGHCLEGPALAIYPEGKILVKVRPEDIQEIKAKYLC